MNFRYKISLRIWQDIYTRNELSLRLGMEHEKLGRAPERPVKDDRTFWRRTLAASTSDEKEFEETLDEVLTRLETHSVLLRSLPHGDGGAELFIGLFPEGPFMHYLSPKAMLRAGQLGVGLYFDTYPAEGEDDEG